MGQDRWTGRSTGAEAVVLFWKPIPKNRLVLLSCCFEFMVFEIALNRAGLCP